MFGNPLGEDDFSQRIWNGIMFKLWFSDQEIKDFGPGFAIGFAILLVIFIIVFYLIIR